jgi:hypothetical protein
MATANPTTRRTGYPAEARTPGSTTTRTEKGAGLARGPALILGTILLAAGLYLLYRAHSFPTFSANFPNGSPAADGKFILGLFAANGWTAMLTAVAGGLLLFGAAQHLLAKTMSLIVGAALGVATVIALISGNVLGMAATNGWTKLAWAVCAVILLFNTLVPRRRRTVVVSDEYAETRPAAGVRERDERDVRARDDPAADEVPAERRTGAQTADPVRGDADPAEPARTDARTDTETAEPARPDAETPDPARGEAETAQAPAHAESP